MRIIEERIGLEAVPVVHGAGLQYEVRERWLRTKRGFFTSEKKEFTKFICMCSSDQVQTTLNHLRQEALTCNINSKT